MKPKIQQMDARAIVKLLAERHAEDVFVSECKDGPSQASNYSRIDGWAMKKSWAHPLVMGYEIKVSRGDFLQDKKWRAYLPMCNELYFVAPKGIVQVDELAAEVGLIEVVGTSRLLTRKRAAYRDVVIPEDVFRYILMCRARIGEERDENMSAQAARGERWRQWLATKTENRELGYEVQRGIRENVQRVENENKALKDRMDDYDGIRAFLKREGLDPDRHLREWDVERKLNAQKAAFPEDIVREISNVSDGLQAILRFARSLEPSQHPADYEI